MPFHHDTRWDFHLWPPRLLSTNGTWQIMLAMWQAFACLLKKGNRIMTRAWVDDAVYFI